MIFTWIFKNKCHCPMRVIYHVLQISSSGVITSGAAIRRAVKWRHRKWLWWRSRLSIPRSKSVTEVRGFIAGSTQTAAAPTLVSVFLLFMLGDSPGVLLIQRDPVFSREGLLGPYDCNRTPWPQRRALHA